ncbi:MAG: 3-dehydroquinate synthase [Nitrospirae bacterium]|nr:3-dehydroquinate synthase [Nitrospirota bacterium]
MGKNIILVGFMGSGKSSVGRELARSIGYGFVDTDKMIEAQTGMSIREAFERDGEPNFRRIEKGIIRGLADIRSSVIATGGGAIVDPENLESLKKNGIMIWLKATPDAIMKRTEGNSDRPLLGNKDRLGEIKRLLEIREPYYKKADISIDTTRMDIPQIVSEIAGMTKDYTVEDSGPAKKVRVGLGSRAYDIDIGVGLDDFGTRLLDLGLGKKIAVVTNPKVNKLYGKRVLSSIKKEGFEVRIIEIPDGERYKTIRWANHIYDNLIDWRFERSSCLIALGGGVIGDITGFAAATFLRGISYIQVPTTLVAQVDSSVGGKTGLDHKKGKNLIGAFYQPRLVYIDPSVLASLDKREFIAGMAEVIKYGAIADRAFFSFLEKNMDKIRNLDPGAIYKVILRSCEIKAQVVAEDEREADRRRILNFGHTIGHAIETLTGYSRLRHGEAVAIGMLKAAELSGMLEVCSKDDIRRLRDLISSAGLPIAMPKIGSDEIIRTMELDKKVSGGEINFVLMRSIGDVFVRPVSRKELVSLLKGT